MTALRMLRLPPAFGLLAALVSGTAAGLAAQKTSPGRSADSSASAAASAVPARPDTLGQATVGAPVIVRGDTVLYVPARFGAFTAAERAAAVADRVRKLSRVKVDSLVLVVGETSTDVLAGETVLMTVSDADAAARGVARAALAAEFSAALLAEVERVSLKATLQVVALGAFWTLLATAALLTLLVLLNRFYPKVTAAIDALRRRQMTGLRVQGLELLSAGGVADVLTGAAGLVRAAVVVVLVYFYLLMVLSFFPWTQAIADSLIGYITSPLLIVARAFFGYLPNVFFIAVIVVVTQYVLKVVHLVFGAIGRGMVRFQGFEREWAEPTYKIARFLIIAFALVVLFPYLPGAKSDAFKGVSLFLGVLISFGSSSAIANAVAGVVLTYTRAFNIGDRVKIGDTMGDVVAKSLLVTRIRTIKNVDHTIPNAMVLGAHILNYTAMAKTSGLILNTSVTIGYDAPWRTVHELLVAAAKATPNVMKDPEPFVLQTSLDDFYVSYEINAYTDDASVMARTYSMLHANIQDQFNEAGLEIMSPHYSTLRDGNEIAIPAASRPKDYVPPPFRIKHVGGAAE